MKNYFLNDKDLNINPWIDLIFGVNQEKSLDLQRSYYSKDKYINPSVKEQPKEIKNPLNLELVEFGVQPLKTLSPYTFLCYRPLKFIIYLNFF